MEFFGNMASGEYGPVWVLVAAMAAALAWLVRAHSRDSSVRHSELRELLKSVMEERAASRAVLLQLTQARRALSEKVSRSN